MKMDAWPNTGGALLPDPQMSPERLREGALAIPAGPGEQGTALPTGLDYTSVVAQWVVRQRQWYDGFQQQISGRLKQNWALWRAFDSTPSFPAGQEWRDRTVIPECFKIIMTRLPRLVLGLWGSPEDFACVGRGFEDQRYEEQVRVLVQECLDAIGTNDPQTELFLTRIINGTLYREIMGHVFWYSRWHTQTEWLRTKVKENGAWRNIEMLETTYDGLDIDWLPISTLAFDLRGRRRRWAIERVPTSLEALKEEDERYSAQHQGVRLYPNIALLELETMSGYHSDKMEEPRDTERWPMDDGLAAKEPGTTPVDLWLCWDNVKRTLTKIANSRVVLAHGLAPTPRGYDPYISNPAIPIPGVPYGDSILHWSGPLAVRQTRIARGRMDETMMNLFQQMLYREGSIPTTQWFWRPGGLAPVTGLLPEQNINNSVFLVPRRPLPPEAYQEEQYAQQQAEATAGADATVQGIEATSKSRDVSAAEINQRAMQGSNRYDFELLFQRYVHKLPILQSAYDNIRMNMTQPKIIRVLNDTEGEPMDLTKLERPSDIIIADPRDSISQAERMAEIEKITNIVKDPNMAPAINFPDLARELFRATKGFRNRSQRFVKTQEQMNAALQQQAMAGATAPNAGGPPSPEGPPGSGGAGMASGDEGLSGPGGAGAPPPPTAPGSEYI